MGANNTEKTFGGKPGGRDVGQTAETRRTEEVEENQSKEGRENSRCPCRSPHYSMQLVMDRSIIAVIECHVMF